MWDIVNDVNVPQRLRIPKPQPAPESAARRNPKPQPKACEHVQKFRMRYTYDLEPACWSDGGHFLVLIGIKRVGPLFEQIHPTGGGGVSEVQVTGAEWKLHFAEGCHPHTHFDSSPFWGPLKTQERGAQCTALPKIVISKGFGNPLFKIA